MTHCPKCASVCLKIIRVGKEYQCAVCGNWWEEKGG